MIGLAALKRYAEKMNAESTDSLIKIEHSGDLVWGCVKLPQSQLGDSISLLIAHDGSSPGEDWESNFTALEQNWDSIAAELDSLLPGGLSNSELYRIDQRAHIAPSLTVLHYTTTGTYDWYVRIGADLKIETAAEKD